MNFRRIVLGFISVSTVLAIGGGQRSSTRPSSHDFHTATRALNPFRTPAASRAGRTGVPLAIPVSFEPNVGQAPADVRYVARGRGFTALLTDHALELVVESATARAASPHPVRIEFNEGSALQWQGVNPLRATSNYFVGRSRSSWRTGVPHFAAVQAANLSAGVDAIVYGNSEGLEYDLRLAPGSDAGKLRVHIFGAQKISLAASGDLLIRTRGRELRMKVPNIYEATNPVLRQAYRLRSPQVAAHKKIAGSYALEADGSVGFQIAPHDPQAGLVIDPSLSIEYATFLGGSGAETAAGLAVDAQGNVYIAGTTTSLSFSEPAETILGPGIVSGVGTTQFFIAKIDPQISGPNSLVYLTFLGGTGIQAGGQIAIDSLGDIAITGTTTSVDFPLTDSSQRTAGANDISVSEIDPTGTQLLFSTIFGGSGAESLYGTGGIAIDPSGNIDVASDTSSTDLPVTSGALQMTFGGATSDAFLAIFNPTASPALTYCSYLGTNAETQVGVGGVAVDASANTYIAGFTSNPDSGFPVLNALQSAFGGGPEDGFVMKISPLGQGSGDLIYSTLLGGSSADQALAITVDNATPPNAYVTGTTQSHNFPVNGGTTAYQTGLHANAAANAFFSVIGQNGITGVTYLRYSTYLGGSANDVGQAVAIGAGNAIYISGTTTSFDFPWLDNLQPYNGSSAAFIAKFDPTQPGAASLRYATPLGGTATVGQTVHASAAAIAADAAGHAYVAGQTSAADFPTAISTGGSMNGAQPVCASCTGASPNADAFVVEIQESPATLPSVYFNVPRVAFAPMPIGTQNVPALVAVHNGGAAALTVTSLSLAGANATDFSLIGGAACSLQSIPVGGQCSFEIGFVPSLIGAEAATLSLTDNAPGNPQVLELVGEGQGPLALVSPLNINFGNVPSGETSTLGQTITITNAGNQALAISSINESGTGVAQFPVNHSTYTCGATLAAGQSCGLQAFFQPSSSGSFHAQIAIVDNSGNVANATQTITLSGTGILPAPVANLAPPSLAFGTQIAGNTTGAQSVTLTNQGSAVLILSSVSIAGANASDFAIVAQGSSPCPPTGGSIAAAAACAMAVQFAPHSAGTKSATLLFVDNVSGSPQSIALSGTAVAPPSVQVVPVSVNFAPQSVGIASSPQGVTITNTGGSPLSVNGIALSGANAGDFPQTNNCPPSLGSGASCLVNVSFQPVTAAFANRAAVLTIADNAANSPQSVTLAGMATQPSLVLSPTSVNFGAQLAGASTAPQTITATDNGTGALAFTGVRTAGTNAGDFVIGANTCSGAGAAAGSACTVQISFAPACVAGPANRTAALVLADNATGSPQSVALSGTATGDFCFDPPLIATVTPGQTATYALGLFSPNAYSGTISLSCAGAPNASSCGVSPASVTLPAQFSVSVTTTAGSSAVRLLNTPTIRNARAVQVAVTILASFFFAMLLMVRFARVPVRHMVFSLVALSLVIALAACGGGAASTPAVAGTPAGTYTLMLTGTAADGTMRTLNLTLIVQ